MRPDRVELALYSSWYPSFGFGPTFDVEMDLAFPGAGPSPASDNRWTAANRRRPPEPRRLWNPELPPASGQDFARVLAKSPDERYTTASDFVTALSEALATPVVH